jgi:hypothetical protein
METAIWAIAGHRADYKRRNEQPDERKATGPQTGI